jgi:3-hydroxybutyryl-CoA dehydrogenase
MGENREIGVVGAGMMGAEIALCFALAGNQVVIKDASLELAEKGKARLGATLDRSIKKGRVQPEVKDTALARITPTDSWTPYKDVDIVVEAVFEDFSVKESILNELNDTCKPECLILTNTSSIPITQLASIVGPERRPFFLGAHFFSPASVMALVEIIPGLETAEESVTKVMEICRTIGKTPIRVKDVPGFAVNRLLHIMLIEACRLVDEGVISPEDVDTACKLGLGHPVGPYQLMDLAGNDLCLQVQEILFRAYGESFMPRPNLKQKVYAKHLGRKTGIGWFRYDKA